MPVAPRPSCTVAHRDPSRGVGRSEGGDGDAIGGVRPWDREPGAGFRGPLRGAVVARLGGGGQMQQPPGTGDVSMTQRLMHSSLRTVMAGLFMFLAVSFGGVWLARSGQRRNHKAIAAALLVAFVLGIGAVIVRANAGPPGYIRWQNLPQSLKDGKETSGGVEIELVPGNDNMKLIIPMRPKRNGE